jgi:hypothetical protein
MHTEVKFGPLPDQFRHVIELAEQASRNAYANAISHTELEYDTEAQRTHSHYTELCHEVAVCCHYRCFERTYGAVFCDEHEKGQRDYR